jgi:hypothetical protein
MSTKCCKLCKEKKSFDNFRRAARGGVSKDEAEYYAAYCHDCTTRLRLWRSPIDGMWLCKGCNSILPVERFGGSTRCYDCKSRDGTLAKKVEYARRKRVSDPIAAREQQRKLMKRYNDTLHDTYIKIFLTNKFKIQFKDMQPSLIEAQREILRLQRAIAVKLGVKASTIGVWVSNLRRGLQPKFNVKHKPSVLSLKELEDNLIKMIGVSNG